MTRLFRSKVATDTGMDMDMDMDMGGAITAVAATTMVGIGATTMAGGIIIAIGDGW